jgi:hypothetical protein
MLAGHFMFLFPESITFKKLTLQVTDPSPCDFIDYGGGITGLAGFALEIAGSTPDVIPEIVVRDVAVLGAAGDVAGKNLPWAMFVVLGDSLMQNDRGKGNVTIKNCYVSDAAWRGIVMGSLTDGSSGIIKECMVENSGYGIRVIWVDDSRCQIKENTLSNVWWWPIELLADVSGAEVRMNTVSGGNRTHVLLGRCSAVTVSENTFRDLDAPGFFWTAPIYVRGNNRDCVISANRFININGAPAAIFVRGLNNTNNTIFDNDFKKSGLPGWNPDGSGGPGCVLLGAGTSGNYVDEGKFPPRTNLCEQVKDEGGTNEVAGWYEKCGEE